MSKKFEGSLGILIILIICCWPAAIIYFFMKYEEHDEQPKRRCPNCGRRERADSGYLDIDISVFSYGVINNWKEEHEEQLMKEFEEQYTESEEELELYQQQEKKNQVLANMVQYAAGPVSKARLLNNGKKSFSTETAREM